MRLLSKRYAQDFGPLAPKYGIIGTAAQCAEQLERFIAGGCSCFVMNPICDNEAPTLSNDALTAADVSTVALVTAGVAAATSTVLLVRAIRARNGGGVSVGIAGPRAMVTGRW